jgi:hypothetical protein
MVLPGVYTVKLIVKDKEYVNKVNCVHDESNADYTMNDRKLVYDKAMELQQLYNRVNNTIDSINLYQRLLKQDTLAFSKNKNAKIFYDDLQKVKAELMATKKVSIFADERRLREKVSELYGNFCWMEVKPNATQLESITDLQTEFTVQSESLAKVMTKNLPKNPKLKDPKNIK